MSAIERNQYVIEYSVANGMAPPIRKIHEMTAAYFQTDERFTVFKREDGKPLFMVSNDYLVSVECFGVQQGVADA